jgi:hypothetical protein
MFALFSLHAYGMASADVLSVNPMLYPMRDRMDAYRSAAEYTEMTSIGIARGKLARIHNGRGVLLSVQYGAVWITQSGSIDDVCLDAGESFCIDRNGLTLVSACGRAPLTLLTLEPPIRITPSVAKRSSDRLWSYWARAYRAPSRPSTGWI